MCFMYTECIPLTRGHVCVCYFTRATVSAEQALSVLFMCHLSGFYVTVL